MYRFIGKCGKIVTQTLLLPVMLVIGLETWFRVSAPKDDCKCGCTWQKGKFYE